MPVVDLGPAKAEDEEGVVDLGAIDTGEFKETPENAGELSKKTSSFVIQNAVPMPWAKRITFQELAAEQERKRRTLIKSIPWKTQDAANQRVVTEQEDREIEAELLKRANAARAEQERAEKAGEEPKLALTLLEVRADDIVVPDRIADSPSLIFAYINLPSFRKAIDADPNILDGVSFAGIESDDVSTLYNEIKPILESTAAKNNESQKNPIRSFIKSTAVGAVRAPSKLLEFASISTPKFQNREERIAALRKSQNLSDRIAAETLDKLSENAWLTTVPGFLNAPAAIWNVATLGVAPVPTLEFTPEQRNLTSVFSVAALLIPKSPANFLFKLGNSGVGNVGTATFERFATRFPALGGAIATVVSKPFINRLAAIPVEFAKLKGGQLSFAVFSPENLKRVDAGEHPLSVANDIFTDWFNVDPTTALFATVFGFARGLKLDTPQGRAAAQARTAALKQLGLKPNATNADIRLAMGEWGQVQSSLVTQLIPPQIPKPLPVPVVTTKLITSLKTSLKAQRKARKTVTKAQSVERGKRSQTAQQAYSKARAQGDDVPTASRKALSQLKGTLTDEVVPENLRPKMAKAEWDSMYQKVEATYPDAGNMFTRLNHVKAIDKIRAGTVLQPKEIAMMAEMFGDKLGKQLVRQFNLSERIAKTSADLLGLPRTLMAGGDASFIGRQIVPVLYKDVGDLLTLRNFNIKKPLDSLVFAQASARSLISFFSRRAFDKFREQIENHPRFQQAVDHGLAITKVGRFIGKGEIEEEFGSRIASKWPLIARGNRSAVTAGNWARMMMYDRIVSGFEKRGIPLTKNDLKRIANQVNDMTGRSGIPKGARIAEIFDISNKIFFSPRFALSKVKNIATLHHTLSRSPAVRAEGFRTMVGQVATTTAAVAIARLFGAEVNLDPRSTNFMKAKIGNKRVDLLPGEGGWIRFFARMALGQTTTAAGHVKPASRKRTTEQFLKSKASPIINAMRLWWTGREFTGKKVTGVAGWTEAMTKNFTFLWVQGGIDAFRDAYGTEGDPLRALAQSVAPAGAEWIGMGVQVYPDSARTAETLLKDELAQEAFGKNWIDLAPIQASDLVDQFQDELDTARQAVDVEIQERADFAFATRMLEEAAEAGNDVIGMLTAEPKELMTFAKEKLGLTISLQRAPSRDGWIMNDKRFKRYQERAAEILEVELNSLLKDPSFQDLSDKEKKEEIQISISIAKQEARLDVIDEADDETLEEEAKD